MSTRHVLSGAVARVVDGVGGVPVSLPDGSKTRVAFRCRHISAGYESAFAREFVAAIRPETTVVDVGAHVGFYTIMAARRARRVIAFEPVERNARFLRANLHLAGLNNVEVQQMVVSDHTGEITFYDHAATNAAPTMMGSLMEQQNTVAVTLPCTTLDALNLRPDVLKVDVEGAEAAVMDGAAATLRECRPTLFLEVHHARLSALGRSAQDLRAGLEAIGYALRFVSDHGHPGGEEYIEHWVGEHGSR